MTSVVLDDPKLFWTGSSPTSCDPLDYDAFTHHLIFKSIFSSLITQYKSGEYVGQVAESWISTPDLKHWTFKIRHNLKFENNDSIDSTEIIKSLTRIAYLQKVNHSLSGLTEHLTGINLVKSPNTSFPGIRKVDSHTITLSFNKSMPKVLDAISFGLYSISNSKDFNPTTGEWLNKKKCISSGAYLISHWDDQMVKVKLRKDFLPELRHPKAMTSIQFIWDPKLKYSADIIAGTSVENQPKVNGFEFKGSSPSYTYYASCQSWPEKNGIFGTLEKRRGIRAFFYEELFKLGVSLTKSFFPLAILGVHEFVTPESKKDLFDAKGKVLRIPVSGNRNEVIVALYKAVDNLSAHGLSVEKKEVPFSQQMIEANPHLKRFSADLSIRFTGILIEDPKDDILFMFRSKEGIMLPDADGRITRELKKENFDVQKINELLWDQAIIWPIMQFSYGLWVKPQYDFSIVNLVLPPTELQWIGFNN